ncbi:ABC transporter ATP-binding protein [Bradyrhizobium genosp. P]|uniref:ABC transporter ATP-binding protein n=1 Tax=Bradyrhizobium genosp. P TaxID=83641 RepID=UPI003CE6B63C
MLELADVSCGYGRVRAVENLSLTLQPGKLTALLGPNGAGKTSLIMAIMGHVAIQSGRVAWQNQDLVRLPAVKRAKLGIAVVPEGRLLFRDLTVRENLMVGGYAYPASMEKQAMEGVFELFPRLAERRHQRSGLMSGGEQQMLAIGRALMAHPQLLMVDELSLGLMPKNVEICLEALLKLRAQGITILLVEQNTTRALDVADDVCVLASGKSVYQGPPGLLKGDSSIFDTYLGVAAAGVA